MEGKKFYKDIVIVKCQPKRRAGSVDPPRLSKDSCDLSVGHPIGQLHLQSSKRLSSSVSGLNTIGNKTVEGLKSSVSSSNKFSASGKENVCLESLNDKNNNRLNKYNEVKKLNGVSGFAPKEVLRAHNSNGVNKLNREQVVRSANNCSSKETASTYSNSHRNCSLFIKNKENPIVKYNCPPRSSSGTETIPVGKVPQQSPTKKWNASTSLQADTQSFRSFGAPGIKSSIFLEKLNRFNNGVPQEVSLKKRSISQPSPSGQKFNFSDTDSLYHNSSYVRKSSAPSGITIRSGGFVSEGRVASEDCLPQYARELRSPSKDRIITRRSLSRDRSGCNRRSPSRDKEQQEARSTSLVPSSSLYNRRRFSGTNLIAPAKENSSLETKIKPGRKSVTVLTESPTFVRNADILPLLDSEVAPLNIVSPTAFTGREKETEIGVSRPYSLPQNHNSGGHIKSQKTLNSATPKVELSPSLSNSPSLTNNKIRPYLKSPIPDNNSNNLTGFISNFEDSQKHIAQNHSSPEFKPLCKNNLSTLSSPRIRPYSLSSSSSDKAVRPVTLNIGVSNSRIRPFTKSPIAEETISPLLEATSPESPFNPSDIIKPVSSYSPVGSSLLSKIGNTSLSCTKRPRQYEVTQDTMSADPPTTVRDLVLMLQTTKPTVGPLPGYEVEKVPRYVVGVCMDECYPGLYIGDLGAAMNKEYLKKVGITHVLNTAEGSMFATVDTSAEYYKEAGIKYLGLQLLDTPSANISQYFEQGADFIESCLNAGGKVLVHCFMGISRSSTISASFLMQRKGMAVMEALRTLREHRNIFPNEGFLQQLLNLDATLRAKRGAVS